MARHDLIAHLFPEGVYFAHPGSPWQRGTNENTNGLLRQYLSRNTDMRTITGEGLAKVENLLNTRPRKTLNWNTPEAAFKTELTQ